MANSHSQEIFGVTRTREQLAEAQMKLWGAMYYVRNGDVGISETQLKRAIQCIEKLQAQLHEETTEVPS